MYTQIIVSSIITINILIIYQERNIDRRRNLLKDMDELVLKTKHLDIFCDINDKIAGYKIRKIYFMLFQI